MPILICKPLSQAHASSGPPEFQNNTMVVGVTMVDAASSVYFLPDTLVVGVSLENTVVSTYLLPDVMAVGVTETDIIADHAFWVEDMADVGASLTITGPQP